MATKMRMNVHSFFIRKLLVAFADPRGRRRMKAISLLSLLALIAPGAVAQSPARGDNGEPPRGQGWSLGAGVMAREGIYGGEGSYVLPLPLVGYEGEHFYLRGISGGYHAIDSKYFSLDAELSANPGVRSDDFDAAELAANGVNRDFLEDRDWGMSAGLVATLRSPVGELKIEARTDITDVSGGQEYGVAYKYPISLGRTLVSPTVGVQFQSEKMANYYFGTLDTEVARGVADYKPGSFAVPHAGLSVVRPLNDKWTIFGAADYRITPDEMKASPLIDGSKDGFASVVFAVTRRF
jgi:outer membrane protein